jgi:hypothetical protein
MLLLAWVGGCSEEPNPPTHACDGQADGTACNDDNPCTASSSCQGGVCTGAEPVVCVAAGPCHEAGTCDPSTGKCSNPLKAEGSACNDGNACTQTDTCNGAGECQGTEPINCTNSACATGGTCNPATGACEGGENQADGTACNDDNPCTGSSSCQAGVCTGADPVVCAAAGPCKAKGVCQTSGPNAGQCTYANLREDISCDDANPCTLSSACKEGECTGAVVKVCVAAGPCYKAGTCNPATGECSNPFKDEGSACHDDNPCTYPDTCDGAGTCQSGNEVSCMAPQAARHVPLSHIAGLAMQPDGTSYVTGRIVKPTKVFEGVDGPIHVTASGPDIIQKPEDVAVAKYDPETKKALWARNYGAGAAAEETNASDQSPSGIAVTADGTVAVVGQFQGGLASEEIDLKQPEGVSHALHFLIGLEGAAGDGRWGHAFDLGSDGSLKVVASNPKLDRIAVCGHTNLAAEDLVPGAKHGGKTDLVVGVFDSSGIRVWSRQIGANKDEECDVLVIDDNGNLYAAGWYKGEPDFGLGALPKATGFKRLMWVAKFGASGTTVANASFGPGRGEPLALALDAQGKLVLAGTFSSKLNFDDPEDSDKALESAGKSDAFVVKLDPAAGLASLWSVRLGGPLNDGAAGVALTSTDDVVAVGYFYAGTTGTTATTGAAELASVGGIDAFVLKLSGNSGATQGATTYGDAEPAAGGTQTSHTQSIDRVMINSQGTSHPGLAVLGGHFDGNIAFPPPAGTLTTEEQASFLLFAEVQYQ